MKKKRLLALVAVTVLFSLVYLMGIESIQSNASTPPSRGKNSKILREDNSRRREFEKHFELVDGMYMAVSYSEPVHKKVNEKWEEVDNTLISTTDKNGKVRYRARNPINEISFSKTLEDDLVSMECDGNSISWGLKVIRQEKGEKGQALSGGKQKREGLRRAEAVICKSDLSTLTKEEIQTLADKSMSTIRYNDVLEGGVDLEYLVLPSQVKENIILNAPQDITAYIVNVQTNNLSARLLEDNQVEFLNGSKVVFTMWSPYMYDSAGELSEDIKVELQDKGSGNFTITMTPDAQWLNDSKRVYPVTIDPTVTAGTPIAKSGSTGSSTGPHLHFQLQKGNDKTKSYNPLVYYHAYDTRSDKNSPKLNPNPMFKESSNSYVPNNNFNFTYTNTEYNSTHEKYKSYTRVGD